MTDKKDDSNAKFVVGAALGALVGAVAGVLFAPRSGKETRKLVKEKAKEYKKEGSDFVAQKAESAKDAVKNTIEKIKK